MLRHRRQLLLEARVVRGAKVGADGAPRTAIADCRAGTTASQSSLRQLGTPRGINEWCSRGWCRLEQLGNFLSETQKPLIVVKSPTFVESYTPCGTIFTPCWRTSVGEGQFTVDDDRVRLGPVIRGMIDFRRSVALAKGELFYYRILHSLADKLLRGTDTSMRREACCEMSPCRAC